VAALFSVYYWKLKERRHSILTNDDCQEFLNDSVQFYGRFLWTQRYTEKKLVD
jgi:hypothetical protein